MGLTKCAQQVLELRHHIPRRVLVTLQRRRRNFHLVDISPLHGKYVSRSAIVMHFQPLLTVSRENALQLHHLPLQGRE